MARKLRIQYAGAIYHVMSRGNGKAAVFRNEVDRHSFVQTLAEACAKTDWQVHAYRLMKTHFHLVVETPRANLVPCMKWLLSTYTIRFNRRHKVFGHLFSGRYQDETERKKTKVIIPRSTPEKTPGKTPETDAHALRICVS